MNLDSFPQETSWSSVNQNNRNNKNIENCFDKNEFKKRHDHSKLPKSLFADLIEILFADLIKQRLIDEYDTISC